MKVKGLRWWIITLIGVATVINYIDRSAINIMWPYIYKDFGIADAQNKEALAYITSLFMIAYLLGQTFMGKMIDSIGTRIGFVFSIVGWSISIALHALAKGLISFSAFRFFLGYFEAGNWPGATKSNAEWFPSKERAIAQGIFGAGASLGSVVAAPFIASLYLAFGWQATFIGIAALGFLWIIPWLWVNKDNPKNHPWLSHEEREHITSDPISQNNDLGHKEIFKWWSPFLPVFITVCFIIVARIMFGVGPDILIGTIVALALVLGSNIKLLRFRNAWAILSSRFFIDPVWWMFVTWLPTFLKEQFRFDIKQVGAFAWLPYLFAAVGGLLGGFYSSMRVRKGVDAAKARKEAITIGSALMLVSLALTAFYLNSLKENIPLAIGLISTTLFGFQFLINNIQTLPSDYFHGKNVGTVAGMGGTTAVAGTLITT
ncbi:MAG: MFS transporter, partial [Gammaproteobacteria bacterium]